jgi:hypothetical protein
MGQKIRMMRAAAAAAAAGAAAVTAAPTRCIMMTPHHSLYSHTAPHKTMTPVLQLTLQLIVTLIYVALPIRNDAEQYWHWP